MLIDDTKYKLKESNYHQEVYEKTQIIVGHNSRKDMRHCEGWLRRDFGNFKKTSAFSIDRDGKVYQHFDPKYYSDFVEHQQDKCSIGITLVNVGWLKYDNINNIYLDWLGHTYSVKNEFFKKSWREKDFWFPYTKEQEESLFFLIKKLCNDFNIEKECINSNVYDKDVDIYKGVVFRSNYSADLTDISPAFKIENLKEVKNG